MCPKFRSAAGELQLRVRLPAACKTVDSAYVGSNPTPATSHVMYYQVSATASDLVVIPLPRRVRGLRIACPGDVGQICAGPAVLQSGRSRPARADFTSPRTCWSARKYTWDVPLYAACTFNGPRPG
jgi:hypothetical protein